MTRLRGKLQLEFVSQRTEQRPRTGETKSVFPMPQVTLALFSPPAVCVTQGRGASRASGRCRLSPDPPALSPAGSPPGHPQPFCDVAETGITAGRRDEERADRDGAVSALHGGRLAVLLDQIQRHWGGKVAATHLGSVTGGHRSPCLGTSGLGTAGPFHGLREGRALPEPSRAAVTGH